MHEVKKDYEMLDRKIIFNIQTSLIKEMNESFSNNVFANFISNYKDIATIGQFFNSTRVTAKQRLILENRVSSLLVSAKKEEKGMKHIDNLAYKTFVKKFNETYDNTLREEQKSLLTNYITSFSDNGLGLKSYLNEEIGRLKTTLNESLKNQDNSQRLENTKKVLQKLESFSKTPITESLVRDVFYIQDLAHEVSK